MGGGGDGEAGAVGFGEGFDFDERVAEVEVGPAVSQVTGIVRLDVDVDHRIPWVGHAPSAVTAAVLAAIVGLV